MPANVKSKALCSGDQCFRVIGFARRIGRVFIVLDMHRAVIGRTA